MKALIQNKEIVQVGLPETFKFEDVSYDCYPTRTDLHHDHGWREVIVPEISSTQKMGEMYYDETNDVVTYHIIEKTEEEIQNEILAEAKAQQEAQLMAIKNAKILQEIQEYADEDALNNQAAYPFWSEGLQVKTDEKYQDFNHENELVLWRVLQDHTTQADWRPKDAVSLFVRVGYDGEILPHQTGYSYMKGDKCKWENAVWESIIDNNVWSPSGYPQGWTKLYDL